MELVLQGGAVGGPLGSAAELVGLAGGLVLVLVLVAFGAFAYRSLTGGIEWPDDEESDGEGVTRSHGDDEWKYY